MRSCCVLLLCLVWSLGLGAAQPTVSPRFPKGFFSEERVARGKMLSQTLCATCHLWPSPETLDRETWINGPLPWMMTVCGLTPEALPAGIEGELIRKSDAILATPAVSKEDFGTIIAYYAQSAPKTLPRPDRSIAPTTLWQFRARALELKSPDPTASLVQINPTNGVITVGDGQAGQLERVSAKGQNRHARLGGDASPYLAVPIGRVPVGLVEFDEGLLVTCAGSFGPSEQAKGSVVFLPRRDKVLTNETQ